MNYEMFTNEGNKAIADLLDEMAIALKEKPVKDLWLILNQKMLRISEVHGEIFDTEPRYHISVAMQKQAREVLNIELDADYWGLI